MVNWLWLTRTKRRNCCEEIAEIVRAGLNSKEFLITLYKKSFTLYELLFAAVLFTSDINSPSHDSSARINAMK
jgi:hypothetical protein